MRPRFATTAAALAIVAGSLGLCASPSSATTARPWRLPPARHVFVVNLENKSFAETWGPGSPATYLNNTLRPRGQLLDQYYGIGHVSLDNYIAEISGQGPNPQTQSDCQFYSDFAQLGWSGGQAVGTGCVFPTGVMTVADQLSLAGLTWKGYMEDMGNGPGAPTTCRHPALNSTDNTQSPRPGDQYAARHNPFVYFHSIIDSPKCAADDVPLDLLTNDLRSVRTTANLSFITPNLCNDGHDTPSCVDGKPGGLVAADAWLQTWIPRILSSPAFTRDGVLVVTFDEAEPSGSSADASSCCGEGPGPNSPLPGITGLGGGRVGALVVSRWTYGARTNATAYNHYGLLRTIEDVFGLGHLGYAGSPSVSSFGHDVFDKT